MQSTVMFLKVMTWSMAMQLHLYFVFQGGFAPTSQTHWIQNILIIDSWTHWMKGGSVFRTMGIKEGERKGYQCDQKYHLIKGWIHSDFSIEDRESKIR